MNFIKKTIAILLAALFVIGSICACSKESEPPIAQFGYHVFDNEYAVLAEYITIGADGSYIEIVCTSKNGGLDYVEELNKKLGFKDSVRAKMLSTTSNQGKQSESNNFYKVTWSYHPDNGLEVLYEIKN